MIYSVIKEIVDAMTANGDSFSFIYSQKGWLNLQADDASLPVVFMDPVPYEPKIVAGGHYKRQYFASLLFLYKDQHEDSDTVYNVTDLHTQKVIELAKVAEREFVLRLDQEVRSDDPRIMRFTLGRAQEVRKILDCDLSGILLPVSLELAQRNPVCLDD